MNLKDLILKKNDDLTTEMLNLKKKCPSLQTRQRRCTRQARCFREILQKCQEGVVK